MYGITKNYLRFMIVNQHFQKCHSNITCSHLDAWLFFNCQRQPLVNRIVSTFTTRGVTISAVTPHPRASNHATYPPPRAAADGCRDPLAISYNSKCMISIASNQLNRSAVTEYSLEIYAHHPLRTRNRDSNKHR